MNIPLTDVLLHLIPLIPVNGWGLHHYLTAKGGNQIMIKKFEPTSVLELFQKEMIRRA